MINDQNGVKNDGDNSVVIFYEKSANYNDKDDGEKDNDVVEDDDDDEKDKHAVNDEQW